MGAKWSNYIGKISMSVTTMVWVRMPSRDWNIDAPKKNHDPIPLQSNLRFLIGCLKSCDYYQKIGKLNFQHSVKYAEFFKRIESSISREVYFR